VVYLLALPAAVGFGAIFWAIRPLLFPSTAVNVVDERMAFYGADATFSEDIARLSFRERMIQPTLDRLTASISRLTPGDYRQRLELRLEEAGRPSGLGAVGYLVLRTAASVVGAALGMAIGIYSRQPLVGLVLAVVLAAAIWIGIAMWVSSLVSGHRHEVEVALPNLIDFLVISVSAGLTFDRALSRVVAHYDNALTRGLGVALTEVQLGRPRMEALDAYGRRSGVADVHGFIQACIGSERMGVPMADILRVQADAARWRRGDKAAQLGATATVKMTIPMVLFIFPTIWLVLLGPALFQVFRAGL
jgi:tight adherence protein C